MKTYEEAKEILGNRMTKKLKGHTYLEALMNDEIGVVLWNTMIIKYRPNGLISLHSGGYHTKLTKDRINEYTNAQIVQRRGRWFIRDGWEFEDGLFINSSGLLFVGNARLNTIPSSPAIGTDLVIESVRSLLGAIR